jgi:hypothetical protein
MIRKVFNMFLFLAATSAFGQNWTLKDSGAGLIIAESSSKPVKVIKRSTLWDLKELVENGAIDGIYKGNQLFAAWIQGPEPKEFINKKGKPTWMYKYKLTYPDGKAFISEKAEFLSSGYSCFGIKPGNYKDGIWKIEWFVVNRDSLEEFFVATTVFQTTWGEEAKRDHLIIKNK